MCREEITAKREGRERTGIVEKVGKRKGGKKKRIGILSKEDRRSVKKRHKMEGEGSIHEKG